MNGTSHEDDTPLALARTTAQTNRQRVLAQLGATKARLAPARLREDATGRMRSEAQALRDDAVAHVRAHPVRTALGVAAIAAWVFRKPLFRYAPPTLKRAYDWLSGNLPFMHTSLPEEREAASAQPDDDERANNGDV